MKDWQKRPQIHRGAAVTKTHGEITILRDKLMLRIGFLLILLLTGCDNQQINQSQATAGQTQQIESPLQNTIEGMAAAKGPIIPPTPSGAVSHAGISATKAGPAQAIR